MKPFGWSVLAKDVVGMVCTRMHGIEKALSFCHTIYAGRLVFEVVEIIEMDLSYARILPWWVVIIPWARDIWYDTPQQLEGGTLYL